MEQNDNKKIYFTIGEVAKMLNLPNSTIRYWENTFNILRPGKNEKGNRLFTQSDINNLKTIYRLLKEDGMTIKGVQQKLSKNKNKENRKTEILERLFNIRRTLDEIEKRL